MSGGKWKMAAALALVLLAAWGTASPAYGRPREDGVVTSTELIEKSGSYDGREVVFRGEAVGDILHRGERSWVTVNDDHYSRKPLRLYEDLKGGNSGIGIYGATRELDKIRFLGSYTARGDIVEVRGTFYRASAEHGGDTCIVASSLEVLREGHPLPESGVRKELILAFVLLAACGALTALVLSRRKGRSE